MGKGTVERAAEVVSVHTFPQPARYQEMCFIFDFITFQTQLFFQWSRFGERLAARFKL